MRKAAITEGLAAAVVAKDVLMLESAIAEAVSAQFPEEELRDARKVLAKKMEDPVEQRKARRFH